MSLPQLATAIRSTDRNVLIPALKSILYIVVHQPENMEAVYENIDVGILDKLVGSGEENEVYILSTTILHVVGSSNEKRSRLGSKALCDLIEDNEGIRNSLLNTGFIQIVLHSIKADTAEELKASTSKFTMTTFQSDQSISFPSFASTDSFSLTQLSSGSGISTPVFVKVGLLNVVLKLTQLGYGLESLGILIPVLEKLKHSKDEHLKRVSNNLLQILYSQRIGVHGAAAGKTKDVIVCELEEQIRRKTEEIQKKEEEKQRMATELMRIKDDKYDIEEENRKLKAENEQLKSRDKHRYTSVKPNYSCDTARSTESNNNSFRQQQVQESVRMPMSHLNESSMTTGQLEALQIYH
ncbi:MAG: hypothetical protein EZS28_035918, partial [Streblomastix strix]